MDTRPSKTETPTKTKRPKLSKEQRDKEDVDRGTADGKQWARERATAMQRKDIEDLAHDEEKLFAPELNRPSKFFLFELMVNRNLMVDPSLSIEEKDQAWLPSRGTRLSRAYVRAFVASAAAAWREVAKQVG